MRVRHFPISCEALALIFATGAEHSIRVSYGFPDDARVRGAFTDGPNVVMVVESREFPDVPANEAPPLRSILLEDRRSAPSFRKAAAAAIAP